MTGELTLICRCESVREVTLSIVRQYPWAGQSPAVTARSSSSRNDFSADPDYCAGKIAVASDVDGKIARSYGLTVTAASPGMKDSRGVEINHGFAERTTFIVSPNGRIVATVGGVAPTVNVTRSLEIAERYAAKGK